jgi:hypothetical protein
MWKELARVTVLLSLIINSSCVGEPPLETVKQWNLVTFDFPYDWPMSDKDLFNPEQIVTTGLEIDSRRIFLATPRLFSGVPATISTVSRDTVGDSPVLKVSEANRMQKGERVQVHSVSGFPRLDSSRRWPETVQLQ